MKFQNLNTTLLLILALFIASCDSKPRVIESESVTETASANTSPLVPEGPLVSDAVSDDHKVVVEEALNTERYTYLNVSENGKEYWVAISKREVEIGETYYFKGGLLKKNFFSQEFNRVFETVYLVSNFWKQPTSSESALDEAFAKMQGSEAIPNLEVGKIEQAAGAIKLSDLFSNKEKYNGQLVKVTGKCVKVNPKIMNRNWVHIQDGSGENLDLTVTTAESIPLGAVVTVEGTIALDKDFGAGYRYDIIMEGSVLK
ncbi:MAG: hypothetical protein DHS20C18_28890 [Saprospiraceae bacterium]|nr:MAG: hypothetical protein DHS20C18_28890 [Saprospiraceae bacterium]